MYSIIKRKKFILSLAVILLLTFTFTFIGMPYNNALAAELQGAPTMTGQAQPVSDTVNRPQNTANVVIAPPSDIPAKPGKTKIEIPSRRTANSKTFLEPDGTFSTEIYKKSIYYKNDKLQWVPIVNDIVSSGRTDYKFRNKANRFDTMFGDNAKVEVQEKNMHIDLQPQNAKPSAGAVDKNKIKYRNVYPDVDLEYTSDSDMMKEDIILNKQGSQNVFTYDVKTQNNKIVKDPLTDQLALFDSNNKPTAYFMKPFMIDAKEAVSDKVTLEYKQVNGQDQLVVTADPDWLADPARQYPVKIDPTIFGSNVMMDTFVSSTFPSTSFATSTILSSGVSPSYGTTRSFIQYVLPSIPSSANITSASFTLNQILNNTASTVGAYKITSGWSTGTTTWNAQPVVSSSAETSINSNLVGNWTFLITGLMQAWYSATTPNWGIAVKNTNEASGLKQFYSSNNSGAITTPYITINYKVDPIGQEDQWGFTPDGVNIYNGNLLHQATDVSTPGRGIPVSFSRSYNSRSTKDSIFGYGWVANVGASLKDSGEGPIILTDEDGTEHTFSQQADGTFAAPTGVFLNLVKDYNTGTYTLTTPDQTQIQFNSAGKISKVIDAKKTPNTTTYNYDANGKLTGISDASGRVTNFYYNAGGKLSQITDPAGRNFTYGYDTAGNLTSVTDPAGKATTYGYDTGHNLTSVTDPNGNQVSYVFDASDRVTDVKRTVTVNGTPTTGDTVIAYDPATYTTSSTDAKGNKTTYTYDVEGRLTDIAQTVNGVTKHTNLGYDTDNNVNTVTDNNGQTYSFDYQADKGNLVKETDPASQGNPTQKPTTYSYDADNNRIKTTDSKTRAQNDFYDTGNNNIQNTDTNIQTKADSYFDNGNLQYENDRLSANENLATNSSAEIDANSDNWPDEWDKYQDTGSTTDFFWSTTPKFGSRSFAIGDTTSWATIQNTNGVQYDSTKTYVLSGYIQTVNLTSKSAYLKVMCYGANNQYINEVRTAALGDDNDWTRVQLVLDKDNIPAGTVKMYAAAGRSASNGNSRFDGIQLEVGSFQSEYQAVENASMEIDTNSDLKPDKWQVTLSNGDGMYDLSNNVNFKARTGKYAFKLVGQAGVNKWIKQRIYYNGDANSKFTLSAWSYAENPNPGGGNYAIQTAMINTDGTTTWNPLTSFTKSDHTTTKMGWEPVVTQVTATKAFNYIDVYFMYYNQTGNGWLDTVRLQPGFVTTKYDYDTNGNYVTAVTDPLGNKTQSEYDTIGNNTKIIDPKGNATSYAYDLMNRLTQVTDAMQGVTKYEYDNNGNRTKVTDARNNATTYGYNELNQVKSITDPLGNAVGFDYDVAGNQTSVSFPGKNSETSGYKVNFGYDNLSQLTSIGYNDANQYTFGYDANGNRTAVTDVGKGQTTTYSYDNDNSLTDVQVDANNKVHYDYDETGNVIKQTTTVGSANYVVDYGYGATDNLEKIIFGSDWSKAVVNEKDNDAGVLNSNNTRTFVSFDDANRLTNLRIFKGNGNGTGNIGNYTYTHDANGNITSVALKSDTLGTPTISYIYDALNRLTSETLRDGSKIDYTYDAAGNRLTQKVGTVTTNYTYNLGNELTAVGGVTYSYDKNGNLIDDGSKTYEYDYNNRLTKVTSKSDGSSVSYEYDASGRRISKTVDTIVTKYYYDADSTRVLYETDGSGAVQVRFIYGAGDSPIAMGRGGSTYFYHYNGHGDVVALTDSTGAIVAEYDYDAYGNPVSTGKEGTVVNPYRYAGYRWDSETGMYYLNARYYAPAMGRFITRDSIPTTNLYAYVNNNPVKMIDSSGKWMSEAERKYAKTHWSQKDFNDVEMAGILYNLAYTQYEKNYYNKVANIIRSKYNHPQPPSTLAIAKKAFYATVNDPWVRQRIKYWSIKIGGDIIVNEGADWAVMVVSTVLAPELVVPALSIQLFVKLSTVGDLWAFSADSTVMARIYWDNYYRIKANGGR